MAKYNLFDAASLVTIPTGVKDGKLYSIKPEDGSGDFTFSRDGAGASPATRVNSQGLIEKGRENLILQSNQFDTTWFNSNSTETSGQSGYDGSNDAWLLTKSAANGMIYQSITSSGVQTLSVYAKEGTNSWMQIYVVGSTNVRAYYNLSDGTLGAYALNVIDRNIEDIGSGWYRCSVTFNSSLTSIRFFVSDGNNNDGGTSGSIYIQDAQLEQGLVATDYIETTTAPVSAGLLGDTPRLDYSNGATCPSLLLEPSRTNLITQSEYFGTYSNSNSTDEANIITSPEGLTNATSFLEAATTGQHKLATSYGFDGTSTYTFSIFAKSNGRDLYIDTQNSNEWGGRAWFDLTAGTAHEVLGTADIKDYGNGWYRCSVSGASILAGGNQIELLTSNGSTNSTTGDITKGVYIYGAQLEQGSYPTSYIPTYGSASGRAVDTTYIQNGMTSLNSVDSMTIYFEVDAELLDGSQRYSVLTDLTASNNWIFLSYESNTSIRGYIRGNSNTSWDFSWSSGVPSSGTIKAALVIPADGNAKIYGNGQLRASYSGAVLVNGFDTIALGGTNGAVGRKQALKQFMVFPTALTDAECIALTTL